MLAIRMVSVAGVVVMVGAVAMGLAGGNFAGEGSEILGLVWGRVTLVDLYVGLALFSVFVAWRERRPGVAIPWIVAFSILGNLATALYLAIATFRSESVADLMSPIR